MANGNHATFGNGFAIELSVLLSKFADITHIPFPPIYERFLETIGIFTFDLGWIFSASCLTTRLTFYDKLL